MPSVSSVHVDAASALALTTLTVRVVVRRGWLLRLRLALGLPLIRLAAWVLGCGVRIQEEE